MATLAYGISCVCLCKVKVFFFVFSTTNCCDHHDISKGHHRVAITRENESPRRHNIRIMTILSPYHARSELLIFCQRALWSRGRCHACDRAMNTQGHEGGAQRRWKDNNGVRGRQRDKATQAEEKAEKVLEIGEKNAFKSKFHHLFYIPSAWFCTFCIFRVSTSCFLDGWM